jgi:starch-binding outer membrane protein, SusD/RagB family
MIGMSKNGVLTLLVLSMLLTACAEFIDVGPPKNEITGVAVYKDDATATAAIVGIYAKMSEAYYFNNVGIPMLTGLTADEFINGNSYGAFEESEISPSDPSLTEILWQPGYKYIYYANVALEGLANSTTGVSTPVRRSLQGQAYFVRALCYFYLVNLFGELPKVTGSDYDINAFLYRLPVDSIHALIDKDLERAGNLLPRDFSTAYEQERTLPTIWALHALQARVALYRGQWAKAASEADSVILNEDFFSLPPPDENFLYTTTEAIWQIKPIFLVADNGTTEALTYTAGTVYLQPSLVEAFEPGDGRKVWIDSMTADDINYSYIPFKYRFAFPDHLHPEEGLEYHVEFRLAEQYLIRAEARAHQADLEGAIADLDMLRARAGLPLLADMGITWTQDLVLERVMQERRVELFSEGHRWFDLIRTGQADAVLGTIEGKLWESTDVLYPIPQSEINKNKNLEPQNDGY